MYLSILLINLIKTYAKNPRIVYTTNNMDRFDRKYILGRAGYKNLSRLAQDMDMSYNWIMHSLRNGFSLLQTIKLLELTEAHFKLEDLLSEKDLELLQTWRISRSKQTS